MSMMALIGLASIVCHFCSSVWHWSLVMVTVLRFGLMSMMALIRWFDVYDGLYSVLCFDSVSGGLVCMMVTGDAVLRWFDLSCL